MNKKENHSAKSEIEQALLRLMTQKYFRYRRKREMLI